MGGGRVAERKRGHAPGALSLSSGLKRREDVYVESAGRVSRGLVTPAPVCFRTWTYCMVVPTSVPSRSRCVADECRSLKLLLRFAQGVACGTSPVSQSPPRRPPSQRPAAPSNRGSGGDRWLRCAGPPTASGRTVVRFGRERGSQGAAAPRCGSALWRGGEACRWASSAGGVKPRGGTRGPGRGLNPPRIGASNPCTV